MRWLRPVTGLDPGVRFDEPRAGIQSNGFARKGKAQDFLTGDEIQGLAGLSGTFYRNALLK